MFYNTENFFDCENDSATIDDEFTPEGDRRWNSGRMQSKAERLAKVILAAGKWNPPVFVGLCEVENRKVLELLTNLAPLNKFNYKIVHKDSPDERGIDVALIYRPELFHPFDYQAIPVIVPDDKLFKTRDILRISGILNGCDTANNPKVSGEMINLSSNWMTKSVKTLKNQYTWEVFDQWIVSDSFLESNGCFEFSTSEIFDAGFLLEPDTKFGGVKPKRTYIGFKYQEGFSDHLPVLIRVQLINR